MRRLTTCPYLPHHQDSHKTCFMISIPALFLAFIVLIVFGFGLSLGGTKRGFMAHTANEFPRCFFTVVYSDKYCTVLREIGTRKRIFLVSTEVFGGKPIRPKDRVRHIKDDKERKALGLPSLGYPPLVKDMEEE